MKTNRIVGMNNIHPKKSQHKAKRIGVKTFFRQREFKLLFCAQKMLRSPSFIYSFFFSFRKCQWFTAARCRRQMALYDQNMKLFLKQYLDMWPVDKKLKQLLQFSKCNNFTNNNTFRTDTPTHLYLFTYLVSISFSFCVHKNFQSLCLVTVLNV